MKLLKKNKKKGLMKAEAAVAKTEQEKVEERKEEVLAQGRKFKYPLQYAKYKIILNTVVIAVVVIALLVVMGWFLLYKKQSSSDVLYRITRILPVAVAEVDGEKVRFADYLMIYKSSVKPLEEQAGQTDEDIELIKQEYKRWALDEAEKYAYALKLGRELGVEVSKEQVAEAFLKHQKPEGVDRSEEAFLKVLKDNFGLDKSEYERLLYLSLMEVGVNKKIDQKAQGLAEQVEGLLAENGGNLRAVAEKLGEQVQYEETPGMIDNENLDGGRSGMAMKLADGQVSEKFVSNNGDGYYFVKLVGKNEEAGKVSYMSLKIVFTELEERVAKLKEEGKIAEYIELATD